MKSSRFSLDKFEFSSPVEILLAPILTFFVCGFLLYLKTLIPLENTTIVLVFLIPVGICASFSGLYAGIAAAVISFLLLNYFFMPDLYTFRVKQPEDLVVLMAFLSVAIVLSKLSSRIRSNLVSATLREMETNNLYELSTILIGTRTEDAVATVMLDKIDQLLRPAGIEIFIESSPNILKTNKNSSQIPAEGNPFIFPLQSPRALIGEIRIWRNQPLSQSESRLLKIIANQNSLAIDRIRLGETARKTRIIEESDRLKSSLLSSVSHELRSPLTAIKTSVSSLRTGDVEWSSEARKELLTTIEEEIDHLNILVGNLLDMSRIEAGVLKPQKKPNILIEIINPAILRIQKISHEHKIVVNFTDEIPMVNVDFIQITQVFTNLLSNSIKYSPAGSKIQIDGEIKNPGFLLISIKNESWPIPENDLERIFEKFYQVNPGDQVTGTGLGLSICKGIIEAHGGKIWAENRTNGMVFLFTLPIINYG